MNDRRRLCHSVFIAGVVLGIACQVTRACGPSMTVTLMGDNPRWAHAGCAYSVDAEVHDGTADSWGYCRYSPYHLIDACFYIPYVSCHDYAPYRYGMPVRSTSYPGVATYTLEAWAQQEFPSQYASDSATVYVVQGSISATPTSLAVGGPRAALTFTMDTPSPQASRTDCEVLLRVGGNPAGVQLWDSETGGQPISLLYGYAHWSAGNDPHFEETVYVQGTSATSDCSIAVLYYDANGQLHPYGCYPPRVDFTVAPYVLRHETISEVPANRNRTLLGIGEEVWCWVEPEVAVNWNCTQGYLSTTYGTNTIFTAVKLDTFGYVQAEIDGDTCVNFTIIPPSGEVNEFLATAVPPGAELGPPDTYMGSYQRYECTILPTTVSFYNADLRENIPEQILDDWPNDDASWTIPAQVYDVAINAANQGGDLLATYEIPPAWLHDGSGYQYHSISISVPEQYEDEWGTWQTFNAGEYHLHEYGSDLQSRGIPYADNDPVPGPWMGPWKSMPEPE